MSLPAVPSPSVIQTSRGTSEHQPAHSGGQIQKKEFKVKEKKEKKEKEKEKHRLNFPSVPFRQGRDRRELHYMSRLVFQQMIHSRICPPILLSKPSSARPCVMNDTDTIQHEEESNPER